MPTLEIAVDARGVTTGLEQANRALDQTAQKADRAEREVEQLGHSAHTAGRDMSAAFAATGGGLAITHGLEGISSGFRSGNSAMAAFAASQALLDLGRFAEDMKSVTAATGGATTIFGTLGNVMRAHPLMTIATVLAGAASVMAIFASDTEQAADEFERLADSMQKVQLSRAGAELLGIGQASEAQQQQNLIRQAANVMAAGGTYGQLAQATGLDVSELLAMQRGMMIPLPRPRLGRTGRMVTDPALQVTRPEMAPQYGITPVPREAARAILRTLYRQLESEAERLKAEGPAAIGAGRAPGTQPFDIFSVGQPGGAFARGGVVYPQGFGTGAALMRQPGMPGTFGYQEPAGAGGLGVPFGMGFGIQAGVQAGAQMQQYAAEQAVLAQQRMDELIAQGEQFGQTIGDAFFRVAEGTMTARQAMAELVRQFAQIAAQGVFRQIGGAVGGAFAPTQTQELANAGAGGNVTAGFSPPR
jgi:hypothetical protein